ncbi:hypothetical protein [Streptomyces sp. NBC_00083]|uniref:hypothetical protein n=1 Tax=Streptomyces sp. NBC_00083 TaxID=2975647 RepID=UPI00225588D1|nr:hypothetical protein [Streptomyces sp. NBC_00083]MCX5387397.1 hypothetical protein [Streptomyces sp. NBC_00083]
MRMRTSLAAGVLAVTAILGSTGTALAHDRDDDHQSGGRTSSCGTFAAAGDGHAAYGSACKHSEWMGHMGWMGHDSH